MTINEKPVLEAEPLLLTRIELAQVLRISKNGLDDLRQRGQIGPSELRLGRNIRYRHDEVIEWLNSRIDGKLPTREKWLAMQQQRGGRR